MKILVDTSVWSVALRKSGVRDEAVIAELGELIREMRIVMIGPIRQELLSGISDEDTYVRLRESIRAFDDLPLGPDCYEFAALLSNRCRKNGVQGSHTDFLICFVALKNGFAIFTLDNDFIQYGKWIDITLHSVR